MFDDDKHVCTHCIKLILCIIKIKFMMILFLHRIYKNIHDLVMNHRQTFNPCLLVQCKRFLCWIMMHGLKCIKKILNMSIYTPDPYEQICIIKKSVLVAVSVVYIIMCSVHAYFGPNIVPNTHVF